MTRMMKSGCLLAVAALVAAKSCAAHPDVSAASAGLIEKYNPGHYVAISERETVAGIQHLDEPALRGVSRRYYWADLEPKEGAYDFAAILPFRKRLQPTYQLYDRFNGRLKLFCSAQEDSYRHDRNDSRNMGNAATMHNQPPPADGYMPMDQIFLFARDHLHVNYLFWTYKNYRGNPGSFDYDDALAVIRKYPSF